MLHFLRQRFVVVVDRDELYLEVIPSGKQGVPDMHLTVVLGSANGSHVDNMAAPVQRPMPFDPGVGAKQDVGLEVPTELFQEAVGRGALPQELVDPPGRAVTHENAILPEFHTPMCWELAKPRLVFVRGLSEGVLVAQLGEVVVPWVSVAAMTIIQADREGLVVITLDGQDLSLPQQGEDPIRVWTKGPHISEAKNGLDLSPPNIFQRGLEGEIVVVDPPTDGNPPVLLWFRVQS